MILEGLAIVAGGTALVQLARKGLTVASGSTGAVGTDNEIRWRARWAIWRWIGEVRSPISGWSVVGEFKTRELAEAQAKAAASTYGVKRVQIASVKIK